MGLFSKDKNDNLYDYLDKEVDKAEIKAVCCNKINEIKFMKLALYIVSTYIASAISTCEFKIYDNDKKEAKNRTYYKLNINPNPNDTATRLKYMFTKKLVLEGKSLVIRYLDNIYFASSYNLANDSILGYEFDNVTIQNHCIKERFTRETSFYFELDDEKVKSILDSINDKYKKMVSDAMKVYQKSINNKWKLKVDVMKQGEPNFEADFKNYVETQLKDFITGDEGVFPELNGYVLEKFDNGNDKTDSSDIRNLRKDIFDMVAQTFKMPPSMMYGNVSNLKEVANQFITFTVKPIAKMIGEEITRNLFTEAEILANNKVEVDISSINYKDIFDIANGVEKLISNGVSNIDEVRKMINLPIINTEFSKQYWMTKNYSKIEEMMEAVNNNNNENANTFVEDENFSNNDNTSTNNSNNDLDSTKKGGGNNE